MTKVPCKIGVEEYVENFLAENSALRRKLQSKAEALLILSKELDQCRTERDQFKLMAEQLQDRYSTLKKKSYDMGLSRASLYSDGLDPFSSGSSLLEVLGEAKEKNKALRIEVEDLKQKLRDANGDIKVLRHRLNQQRTSVSCCQNQMFPSHQREELVQQLETLNQKCTQMEADLQSVLDEKEELVTERDAYKCKVHRLNHELNTLLKGDSNNKLVDIDALVMENTYLQDRLHQAEEEKEMANQALLKYKEATLNIMNQCSADLISNFRVKVFRLPAFSSVPLSSSLLHSMLDKKRSKGSVRLGTNNNTGMVMSHKQVQQLLERGTSAQLPNTAATLADMKSLCLALLEALGDKTLALSHQKKANRILAGRISELEQRLESIEGGRVAAFPSQLLLEGYTGSDVDRDVSCMLSPTAKEPTESDSEGDCVGPGQPDCQDTQESTSTSSTDVKSDSESAKRHSSEMLTESSVCQKLSKLSPCNMPRWSAKPETETANSPSMSRGDPQCDIPQGASASLTEDSLPPQLQLLVKKALEDMKQDAVSG